VREEVGVLRRKPRLLVYDACGTPDIECCLTARIIGRTKRTAVDVLGGLGGLGGESR
jgi:hypothetical protein